MPSLAGHHANPRRWPKRLGLREYPLMRELLEDGEDAKAPDGVAGQIVPLQAMSRPRSSPPRQPPHLREVQHLMVTYEVDAANCAPRASVPRALPMPSANTGRSFAFGAPGGGPAPRASPMLRRPYSAKRPASAMPPRPVPAPTHPACADPITWSAACHSPPPGTPVVRASSPPWARLKLSYTAAPEAGCLAKGPPPPPSRAESSGGAAPSSRPGTAGGPSQKAESSGGAAPSSRRGTAGGPSQKARPSPRVKFDMRGGSSSVGRGGSSSMGR